MAGRSDGACGTMPPLPMLFGAGPRPTLSVGWRQSRSILMSILAHAALAAGLFWLAVPPPTAPSLPPEAVVVDLVPDEPPAEEPSVAGPAPETPAPTTAAPPSIPAKAPAGRHLPARRHADVPAQRVTPVQTAVPASAEAPLGESKPMAAPMAAADGDAGKTVQDTVTNAEEAAKVPVPTDYLQQVLGRLEGAKRYPATAKAAGRQGTVYLRFSIDRTGRLLAWAIERRSGIDALDQEVGDMVQRASPFPAAPGDFPRQQVEMVVPIRFALKTR